MSKIDFNHITISNLKPCSRSVEYFDNGRNHGDGSFGLRVSPKNKRTWFIMYKTEAGKIKRYTLGTYPDISLKDARKKALDTMAKVHEGEDPMAGKQQRRVAPTVCELWMEYQESQRRKKKQKAASTEYEERRRWDKIIRPEIGDMKVEDITPMHISAVLDQVAKTAPVSANRMHSQLKVMFKVAINKGWISIHPMQWLDKPGGSEPARKRFLSDDEIRTLWPHLDKLRPNPRDILKLGVLTAQRPGEIHRMRWEDIDLAADVWTITDSKTGNDHLVPLSPQVREILLNRKNGIGYSKKMLWMKDSGFVFPSAYNTSNGAQSGHAASTKEARKKIQTESGIEGWTAHDLRRTARTLMSRLNIKAIVREKVLNHAQNGVQSVYDRYDYLQEKADALNKLANEIDRILGIKHDEKVVPLQKQG